MKSIIFIVLALTLTLGSNGAGHEANKIEEIGFTENQLYAIAYLGCEGYDENLNNYAFYAEKYSLSDDIPIHYFSRGEYYLVIPRFSNTDLMLYRNEIALISPVLVYEEKDIRPFIVQCNFSDMFHDATISLTYQDQKVEFSPCISLNDGSLQVGERGVNITEYYKKYV